ncbi:MAG: DUF72 domain-containing protein [Planctomycetota bacterium]
MAGQARIGVSGWVYPHWSGTFFPEGVSQAARLAHIGRHFSSVEINGTFYSLKRPAVFEKWRSEVPASFVFAVKASRYYTHMVKLKGVAPIANFFAQGVLRLGAQLGPILWQLPPMLPFTPERARAFYELLPRDIKAAERLARRHDARLDGRSALRAPDGRDRPLLHALEVRHASWLSEESLDLMREFGVALVAADTAGKHPRSELRTADFAYVRLHGARRLYVGHYTDAELDDWATRAARWMRAGSDVYVYFDNTDVIPAAPLDALALEKKIDAA